MSWGSTPLEKMKMHFSKRTNKIILGGLELDTIEITHRNEDNACMDPPAERMEGQPLRQHSASSKCQLSIVPPKTLRTVTLVARDSCLPIHKYSVLTAKTFPRMVQQQRRLKKIIDGYLTNWPEKVPSLCNVPLALTQTGCSAPTPSIRNAT